MNDLNDGTGYLPQISQILIDLTYDEIVDLIRYAITEDDLIRDITEAYFMGKESKDIDPKQTRREVMRLLIMAFRHKNSCFNARLKTPQELPAATLATALSKTGYFARIRTDSESEPALYVYNDSGLHAGTYRYCDSRDDTGEFHNIVRRWNYTASFRYRREVFLYLAGEAPTLDETQDDEWVPVENGAFNVRTQEFISNMDDEYREKFVFLKKNHTAYNPNACVSPIITDPDTGDTYDIDTVIESYFGKGSPMTQLLWELFYSLVRYKKNYRVAHFFCNVDNGTNAGSNGKSTLLSLMRGLIGSGNYCSIKPTDMGKDFALGNLPDTTAILVDEISVTEPIDSIDILKTLATRDASVTTQRKFHDPRTGRWDGNMVFCCNGFPKITEKTGAAERRFYFWNFTKRFTGASDKNFIQDVLVKDERVLEYVLYKILHMGDIKKLSRPQEIDDTLDQYRKATYNTVHEFMNEMALPDSAGNIKLVWTMQPFRWLFELYQAWLLKDLGQHNKLTKKKFCQDIMAWCALHPDDWELRSGAVHRPKGAMEQNEPLIGEYGVTSWYGNVQTQFDSNNQPVGTTYHPVLKDTYDNALMRK